MPSDDGNSSSWKIYLALGLTAAAIATTLTVVFVFAGSSRSTIAWTVAAVLTLIEGLACALVLRKLRLGEPAVRLSGAVWAGLWMVLGLYAVVEIATIIVYAHMRAEPSHSDFKFLSILLAETVLFFIIAAVLVAQDISHRIAEKPALDRGSQDYSAALSVHEALEALEGLAKGDARLMRRADLLGKRLYGVQQALEHSHGGGLGTHEHPASPEKGDAPRREAVALVASLRSAAEGLISQDPAGQDRALSLMEEHTVHLESIVRRLGLQ